MKLFNTIMSKIFGQTTSTPATGATAPTAGGAPPTGSTAPAPAAGAPATPAKTVDVEAVLNDLAAKNSEDLDWKKSIVDLMKLVGMDSSLSNRKELAQELGYSGDMNDSASMNIWLHKQVLKKLAENGGKVPQNLLD